MWQRASSAAGTPSKPVPARSAGYCWRMAQGQYCSRCPCSVPDRHNGLFVHHLAAGHSCALLWKLDPSIFMLLPSPRCPLDRHRVQEARIGLVRSGTRKTGQEIPGTNAGCHGTETTLAGTRRYLKVCSFAAGF